MSAILRTSLLQAISTTVSALPSSSFPLPASTFYSAHVLPARPLSTTQSSTPIDIKHSTFKSFSVFLRSIEKEGLLKLKDVKGELLILSIAKDHQAVRGHQSYSTLRDFDTQRAKRAERAENERNKVAEIQVTELWKPHQQSVAFFERTKRKYVLDLCSLLYFC